MSNSEEILLDDRVTYTLQLDNKFYLVENVPARVDAATGEQFFDPATVEQLQQIVLSGRSPERTIETPVYDYNRSN